MTNLLKNGDFEGGASRDTFTGQQFGELEGPEHWVVFWKEGGPVPHDRKNKNGYRRPECKVLSPKNPLYPQYLDPPRIHEGEQAWQCFTFFGIHDAGLYQQVSGIEPGTKLQATAWAHAWSSNKDNARRSDTDDVGGKYNFTFRVGIDPQGGTDPWADTIVWSDAVNYYDEYQQLPPIEATAAAETITVFIRSEVMWPFKHCDAYWDTVELVAVEAVAPEPEPEPTPEPEPEPEPGPTPTPTPGPGETPEAEVVLQPGNPVKREIFRVVARNVATIAFVRLSFDGGEVLRSETYIQGADVMWRCMALSEGAYTVRVLAGNTELGVGAFEVG